MIGWKQKPVIGLDWGFKTWKWLRLKPMEGNRRSIDFLETLELPEEEREYIPFLKKHVLEHHWEGVPAAVTFQDEALHIRRLELPRMPKEDLQEAIRWQMRDIAEESLENYSIRYSIVDEKMMGDIVRLNLLGFVIKTDIIQKKANLLERIGLKPFFLEPTPVTLAAAVEDLYPSREGGWIGCVDLGLRHPYFIVLGHGKLHFVRTLPGLSHIPWETADYASKLFVELQNALDAFFLAFQTEKIGKIFLAGGGAQHPTLPELFSKNIGIPSDILNPFQKLEPPDGPFTEKEKPFLFGPALGAAQLKP